MPMNRDLYPDDWETISERIRFVRARGACECDGRCGAHDGDCTAHHGEPNPRTESMVILTVAHLDHDPGNSDDDNLLAMCQQCHLAYDAGHHARNARLTRARNAGQLTMPWAGGAS